MMKCVTCDQPLPEGTEEHPGYFAQSELMPDASNPLDFAEEVENMLGYIETLFMTLAEMRNIDEGRLHDLHMLGWHLAEEARRRFGKVQGACEPPEVKELKLRALQATERKSEIC